MRAEKVSQPLTLPFCSPWLNQRTRCALLPWVKLSGTTRPWLCFCRASSPILAAAFMAASMSPFSKICRAVWAWFAQTPAKQSACNSSLTDSWLYCTWLTRPRWLSYFLVVASSSFVYVALADLIPQLQRRLSARETAVQIAMLLMGMAVVTLVSGLAHGGH